MHPERLPARPRARWPLVVGGAVVLAAGVVVALLRQAGAEQEHRVEVERAAVAGYESRYGAAGVAADSSRLFADCSVVDLYVPGARQRPVSVVLTRAAGGWALTRSARGGEYYDTDDVGSAQECRAVAEKRDDWS